MEVRHRWPRVNQHQATTQHIFARDTNGRHLALEDGGTYARERITCNVKYETKTRGLFGVGIKKHADGRIEGVRCEVLDYTGKRVDTISSWEKLVGLEIKRVKALTGEGAPWVVSCRPANVLYKGDATSRLTGAGMHMETRLRGVGIATVKDMKELQVADVADIAGRVARLSVHRLTAMRTRAQEVVPGVGISRSCDLEIVNRITANDLRTSCAYVFMNRLTASDLRTCARRCALEAAEMASRAVARPHHVRMSPFLRYCRAGVP